MDQTLPTTYGPFLSLKQAKAIGAKFYFTGRSCKYGHVALRYVSTRQCSKCVQSHERRYYATNPEYRAKRIAKAQREYQQMVSTKEGLELYRKRRRECGTRYREANRELCNARSAKSILARLKADDSFRLRHALRSRLNQAVKREFRNGKISNLLGCSIPEFKRHIEQQWVDGMSWSNWSLKGWHIDHIKPCAKFDLSDPEQQRQCFHYTNLQPLWCKDNWTKSDSWSEAA